MFLLGLAYFSGIHSLAYFILVQMLGGLLQVWNSVNGYSVVSILTFLYGQCTPHAGG